MERDRMPKPGQLYNHFKNKPYQVITVATHADTREEMVVYQALYGDYKCYIRPLESFLSEVDHVKYPDVKQKYRFELWSPASEPAVVSNHEMDSVVNQEQKETNDGSENVSVNEILIKFLDSQSFYKKLEVITSNRKYMNDRLINDMAVSLDCTVDEGPLDQRIQGLITCLQAMCRFEDKRLR